MHDVLIFNLKLPGIFGISFALVVAALAGGAHYVTAQAELYQGKLGEPLRRELGFAHGSPYIRFGEERREVLTLHPVPGGILAAAGVRSGDIPLEFGITGFYKHLHLNRGSGVTIKVMNGGNGPAENLRAVRTIAFRVPQAPPS